MMLMNSTIFFIYFSCFVWGGGGDLIIARLAEAHSELIPQNQRRSLIKSINVTVLQKKG